MSNRPGWGTGGTVTTRCLTGQVGGQKGWSQPDVQQARLGDRRDSHNQMSNRPGWGTGGTVTIDVQQARLGDRRDSHNQMSNRPGWGTGGTVTTRCLTGQAGGQEGRSHPDV